jgi:hypothetical protein
MTPPDPETEEITSEAIWLLIFTEAVPPTGNTIQIPLTEDVKDELVKALTGVEIATELP